MRDELPQAYPLQWPRGKPRTPYSHRRRAAFGKQRTTETRSSEGALLYSSTHKGGLSVADALKRVGKELDLIGAYASVVSTNLETRLDGLPRSGQRKPDDPGVAVYFRMPLGTGKMTNIALACDVYTTVEDNIAAVAAHLYATRAIERHGVGTFEELFAGFKALPPPVDWRALLDNPSTVEEAEAAYRRKAAELHPDHGGSHDGMVALNDAIAYARSAL